MYKLKNQIHLQVLQRSNSLPVHFESPMQPSTAAETEPLPRLIQNTTSNTKGLRRSRSLPNMELKTRTSDQILPKELLGATSPSVSSQDSVGSLRSIGSLESASSTEIVPPDRTPFGIPPGPRLGDQFSQFENDMADLLNIIDNKNNEELYRFLYKHPQSFKLINLPFRSYGSTLLMYASQIGCLKSVQTLLHFSANTDTQSINGNTALMLAAASDSSEIISALIRKGANVEILKPDQTSVLHIAACAGNSDVLKTLRHEAFHECSGVVNQQCKKGFTALMLAASAQKPEVIKNLLKLGADPYIHRGHDKETGQPKDAIYYINKIKNPVARKECIDLIYGASINTEPGFVHIGFQRLDRASAEESDSYLFVAMDEATGWTCSRVYSKNIDEGSVDFLKHLQHHAKFKISKLIAHNKDIISQSAAKLSDIKDAASHFSQNVVVENFYKISEHPNTKYAVSKFKDVFREIKKQIQTNRPSAEYIQSTLNSFLINPTIPLLQYRERFSLPKNEKPSDPL